MTDAAPQQANKSEPSLKVKVVMTGVLAALVAAVTIFFRIPVPRTGGYLNFGDILVIFAGLFFGPRVGFIVGGVGSAVADIVGFPIFAPFTFVIKGLEGAIPGFQFFRKDSGRQWFGAAGGALVMVLGYFLVEALMKSIGIGAALTELPFNVLQGAMGVLGGVGLAKAVRRW
ncbi:MAG: hypothetical protein HBSAPP02_23160 [Phycisphaerae bacterium]|nr:MAG: hypothetical protein HBSAPP02_23160 [Phycisphaerae bacterium]